MNIVLTGMAGSGKSTVASGLAEALGFRAVDTDEIIERAHGRISDIFSAFGEEYFRKLEREAVKGLRGAENCVIATGGGCVLSGENIKILKSAGTVIYLKTSVAELSKRLKGDSARPWLSGNISKGLAQKYAERAALYQSSADITVETDGKTAEDVIKIILEKINENCADNRRD